MNRDLKVGDKVMLSPDHKWHKSDANPLDVLGVVTDIDPDDVEVTWSNGKYNSYHSRDNDLIKQQAEPEQESKTMKIEVGKVYKCGEGFVKIVVEIETSLYPKYIGVKCWDTGQYYGSNPKIGIFYGCGTYDMGGHEELRQSLRVEVLGKTLYKDEYEAAVNSCKEVRS